jgi:hypothetical protein
VSAADEYQQFYKPELDRRRAEKEATDAKKKQVGI